MPAASPRRSQLFSDMSLAERFEEFLTLPAYEVLERLRRFSVRPHSALTPERPGGLYDRLNRRARPGFPPRREPALHPEERPMTAINAVTDYALDGEVGVITLNSPPVNALSAAVRDGLSAA